MVPSPQKCLLCACLLIVPVIVAIFCFSGGQNCNAHGTHNYKPPPPPNIPRWQSTPGAAPGGPGVGGPSTPGPKAPTAGPGGPSTTGGGTRSRGAGAYTKKARVLTGPKNTWEYWWARNRYQFIDLSNDRYRSRGATTLSNDPDASIAEARKKLRGRAIATLRLFLDDSSARVKRAAMIALGRLKDTRSQDKIVDALQDGNQLVRTAAVLSLGMSGSGQARYNLLHLAQGSEFASKLTGQAVPPPEMRAFAEISLALTNAMGIGSVLERVALDRTCNDEIRAMALEGLGLVGNEKAVKFLIDFAKRKKLDYRLQSATAIAMGKTHDPLVLPSLQKFLSSSQMAIRQSAAIAMGQAASPGDATTIAQLFRAFGGTADISLKGFALTSIGTIGGPEAISKLKMVLKRGTTNDYPWAAIALGIAVSKAANESMPNSLIERLKNGRNRSYQGATAVALGIGRCKKAINELSRQMHEGDDPYLRGYCAIALGMIGDPSAITSLQRALLVKNLPQLNTQAAMALCLLRDFGSIDTLQSLLFDDQNEATVAMAAKSLTYLGDLNVARSLLDFLNKRWSNEMTYMYVMELLSKILSEQKTPFLDPVATGSNHLNEFPVVQVLLDFGI